MKYILSVFTLLTVLMSSGYAQDTVQVKAGWNIIGSVKAGAVPDVLSTVPESIIVTSFFGYSPGAGYQQTDTLGKGFGYWVKVSADGIIIFKTSSSDDCGIKRVDYGGISYGTVPIGGQCWLEENLNVGTMVDSLTNQTDNAILEKYCFGNDPLNCTLNGGMYQWNEAMQYTTTPGTQGICPAGWHIPTHAEFQTFSSAVGGDGNALKAVGHGTAGGAGTNTSGFSALIVGGRSNIDGGFFDLGLNAYFWSSVEIDPAYASYVSLSYYLSAIYLDNSTNKAYGFNVRCLED